MPLLTMLIGLPGCGKSTYANFRADVDDVFVYSTDNYIEFGAKCLGKTYKDVFADLIKGATTVMDQFLDISIKANRDIVWDQTNLTPDARMRRLAKIPSTYSKTALVFPILPDDILKVRLEGRPFKVIPPVVLETMKSQYVFPTFEEGFDHIFVFNDERTQTFPVQL